MRTVMSQASAGDRKTIDLPPNTVVKIHRAGKGAFAAGMTCESDGQHLTLRFPDGTQFDLTGLAAAQS